MQKEINAMSRKHDEKKESWTHEGQKYIYKKKKESWTHEGPSIQKRERERKIAHVQRKRERERERVHEKSPHIIHAKIFAHMHILIKVYELFLLQIRSLT